jgi:hypothetical protein
MPPPPSPPPPPPPAAANGAVPADAANATPAIDATAAGNSASPAATANGAATNTYQEDDLIGAAEGVFGKGAKGLADIIKKILRRHRRRPALWLGHAPSQDRGRAQGLLDRPVDRLRYRRQRLQHLRAGL